MPSLRVLLVDDVDQVRQNLRLVLGMTGNIEIVGEAADGLEAILLTEKLIPEVVLMDLEMPVLNGYEATQQIKSRFPHCRVIALTVHDYPQARRKAYVHGVDAFIVKGDPIETLTQTLFQSERKKNDR
jgi:DNA-binding NarL/FixJ family response regulator